jgi:hypothetical protein
MYVCNMYVCMYMYSMYICTLLYIQILYVNMYVCTTYYFHSVTTSYIILLHMQAHIILFFTYTLHCSILQMPFKLRLKKSKHYNVVSKTLFVICVELLDSTTVECTLSSESIGQECRDNVCQRLGLQQVCQQNIS